MNINFANFALQCASMGVWIFLAAGLYAIVEKLLDKHYPSFLAVDEPAGASQSPGQVGDVSGSAPKQA